jgi:multiple sugar transport system substrate-binding protein
VEFLSRPDVQVRFFHASGDLPARVEAWSDSSVAADPQLAAFRTQLERVVSTPKIPEWEQIAVRLQERAELAVRGSGTVAEALRLVDQDVDAILEKRRWLLERARAGGT